MKKNLASKNIFDAEYNRFFSSLHHLASRYFWISKQSQHLHWRNSGRWEICESDWINELMSSFNIILWQQVKFGSSWTWKFWIFDIQK